MLDFCHLLLLCAFVLAICSFVDRIVFDAVTLLLRWSALVLFVCSEAS